LIERGKRERGEEHSMCLEGNWKKVKGNKERGSSRSNTGVYLV